jgi:hypothetical protein
MARPRKYATNADRQRAYRDRQPAPHGSTRHIFRRKNYRGVLQAGVRQGEVKEVLGVGRFVIGAKGEMWESLPYSIRKKPEVDFVTALIALRNQCDQQTQHE